MSLRPSPIPTIATTSEYDAPAKTAAAQAAQERAAKALSPRSEALKRAEELRQAVRAKNVMWRQFWVPPNWAFLYGNRQSVPSSRSHSNLGYRWFPEEIQTIPSKLVDLDRAIYDRVRKQ